MKKAVFALLFLTACTKQPVCQLDKTKMKMVCVKDGVECIMDAKYVECIPVIPLASPTPSASPSAGTALNIVPIVSPVASGNPAAN